MPLLLYWPVIPWICLIRRTMAETFSHIFSSARSLRKSQSNHADDFLSGVGLGYLFRVPCPTGQLDNASTPDLWREASSDDDY
jgi:hypothetical protein